MNHLSAGLHTENVLPVPHLLVDVLRCLSGTVRYDKFENYTKASEPFLNLTRDLTHRKRISSGGLLVFLMYLRTAMLNSAAMSL